LSGTEIEYALLARIAWSAADEACMYYDRRVAAIKQYDVEANRR
jgi:hypothetical protein